jgi:hypothetical protein
MRRAVSGFCVFRGALRLPQNVIFSDQVFATIPENVMLLTMNGLSWFYVQAIPVCF